MYWADKNVVGMLANMDQSSVLTPDSCVYVYKIPGYTEGLLTIIKGEWHTRDNGEEGFLIRSWENNKREDNCV